MGEPTRYRVLKNKDDYQRAVRRAAELRAAGAQAETNEELAAIEGAMARYVAKPGEPARRRGRPEDSGEAM